MPHTTWRMVFGGEEEEGETWWEVFEEVLMPVKCGTIVDVLECI